MKEGATYKKLTAGKFSEALAKEDKAKLGYRNHEKAKQSQFYSLCFSKVSVARNAKQSQIIAFSDQKQGLPKKQSQIKPITWIFVSFSETNPNGISQP